ncbi:MAG: hypothetical protein WD510_01705 [Balneolaceae bacterium]
MIRAVYFILFLSILFYSFLITGCSSPDTGQKDRAFIHGQITVDAELDTTANYSGIQLFIGSPDTLGELTDTVFYAETDRQGFFEGTAQFENRNMYSLFISRHDERLAYQDLVLADGDTIRVNAELPDFQETAELISRENDLYQKYERLENGINRVFQFVNAGLVTGDSLEIEIMKWSNLFWDFHREYDDSFAGERAAISSVALLEGWDHELMMERLRELVRSDSRFVPFASRIGLRYYARNVSLESALAFLDTLDTYHSSSEFSMDLQRNRIELLYDSARVEDARRLLRQFKQEYTEIPESRSWIDRFEYDLTSLAPGAEVPDFQVRTIEDERITKHSMLGSAYLLELTQLDNRLYQQQYDRGIAIYHIYKNYGIEFVTIPIRSSEVMVNAFFSERPRLWHVARPGSFDEEELRDQFNINVIPTRILVDSEGNVIRKYEGTEFNDIISGLRQILNSNTEDPL